MQFCRYLEYTPEHLQTEKHVFLAYISPAHYNAITSDEPNNAATSTCADAGKKRKTSPASTAAAAAAGSAREEENEGEGEGEGDEVEEDPEEEDGRTRSARTEWRPRMTRQSVKRTCA